MKGKLFMGKNYKRLLCFVLSLTLVLTLLPMSDLTAYADGTTTHTVECWAFYYGDLLDSNSVAQISNKWLCGNPNNQYGLGGTHVNELAVGDTLSAGMTYDDSAAKSPKVYLDGVELAVNTTLSKDATITSLDNSSKTMYLTSVASTPTLYTVPDGGINLTFTKPTTISATASANTGAVTVGGGLSVEGVAYFNASGVLQTSLSAAGTYTVLIGLTKDDTYFEKDDYYDGKFNVTGDATFSSSASAYEIDYTDNSYVDDTDDDEITKLIVYLTFTVATKISDNLALTVTWPTAGTSASVTTGDEAGKFDSTKVTVNTGNTNVAFEGAAFTDEGGNLVKGELAPGDYTAFIWLKAADGYVFDYESPVNYTGTVTINSETVFKAYKVVSATAGAGAEGYNSHIAPDAAGDNAKYLRLSIDITIDSISMTVSSTDGTATYDGNATDGGASVSVTDPSTGFTIKYGTTTGTYDLDSIPTYTDAGEYTVYYKVTADNYSDHTGSFKITISKAAGNISAPTANTLTYTGSEQELVTAGSSSTGTIQYKLGTGEYGTGIPKATNAGTYTVYYRSVGDSNHNDVAESSLTVTIAKADQTAIDESTVTVTDETISGKNDGKIEGLSTDYEYSTDDGSTWTSCAATTLTGLSGGSVKIRKKGSANYNPSEAITKTIAAGEKLTASTPDDATYTITMDPAVGTDYDGSVTLIFEPQEGYTVTEPLKLTVGGVETTFTRDPVTGKYTATIDNVTSAAQLAVTGASGVEDNVKPTGTITISDRSFTTFLNTITFGLFFKETKQVTIAAEDAGSGIKTVSYSVVKNGEAVAESSMGALTWTAYTGRFSIDPSATYIIYAKLEDNAGNIAYICSDGLVLDNVAPVVTGIESGKVYCEATEFTVTETYLDSVKLDDTVISATDGKYTLPADGTAHTVTVTDKAGNVTNITDVKANDGHTFDQEVATKAYLKSKATCQQKAVYYKSCECGEKGTETFESGDLADHDFSGKWKIIKEPTETEDGKKETSCKYGCGTKKVATIPATGLKTEDPSDGNSAGTGSTGDQSNTNTTEAGAAPQTGDTNDLWLWMALMFVSLGIIGVSVAKRKQEDETEM